MRLLDRYLIKEFVGPFVFGLAAFIVVLVGVQLAPTLLKMLIREHFPVRLVAEILLLRIPQLLIYCFPMATLFGILMTMSNMSAHGEIVALRAGGASLGRIAAPLLAAGLVISGLDFIVAEGLMPPCVDRAFQLERDFFRQSKPIENLLFSVPPEQPQRVVYARWYDPRRMVMEDLVIVELRRGQLWQTLKAKEAIWRGRIWQLRDVECRRVDAQGRETRIRFQLQIHDLGRTPAELAKKPKVLDDMSLRELHQELQNRRRLGLPFRPKQVQVIQYIHMHWSLPWLSLFFAFVGIPLGLRPVRTTTGVGLGLSLVIALAYYFMFYALIFTGQQGAISPILAAWLPNAVLVAVGIELFRRAP